MRRLYTYIPVGIFFLASFSVYANQDLLCSKQQHDCITPQSIVQGHCCVVKERFDNSDDIAIAFKAKEKAEALLALGGNISLDKKTVYAVCRFLEKKIFEKDTTKEFSKKETGFPCVIYKAPKQNGYIVTDFPDGTIGQGWHKKVEKGFWYGKTVRLFAICDSDDTAKAEAAVLARLKHTRGIIPFYGLTRTGGKYIMYLEYFPGGSFIRLRNSGFCFSDAQNMKIIKDLSYGLHAIHKKGFVHRDLHLGNMVYRKTMEGKIEAALLDFGQTLFLKKMTRKESIQAARYKTCPEILVKHIWEVWRRPADVYALGSNFYQFLWNKELPYERIFDAFNLNEKSDSFRKKLYGRIQKTYACIREKKTGSFAKKSQLKSIEQVKILVLDMIHPDPKKRPTMEMVVSRLEDAVPKM